LLQANLHLLRIRNHKSDFVIRLKGFNKDTIFLNIFNKRGVMGDISINDNLDTIQIQQKLADLPPDTTEIPPDLQALLDQLPPGDDKTKLMMIVAAIKAAKDQADAGNPQGAQQIIDAANLIAKQLADDLVKELGAEKAPMGLFSALIGVVNWMESIEHLEVSLSELAASIADIVKTFSDKESLVLQADAKAIKDDIYDADGKKLESDALTQHYTDGGNKYQNDETFFTGQIGQLQGLSEGAQTLVSDTAKTLSGDITTLQGFIQMWNNLATAVR
jgi:hypothetical protein